jgi:transcriptional regulator with XRE-family HTH domain
MSARLEAGLTQKEMAKLMATSRSTISMIEAGYNLPTVTTLVRWAEVTGKQLEIRMV